MAEMETVVLALKRAHADFMAAYCQQSVAEFVAFIERYPRSLWSSFPASFGQLLEDDHMRYCTLDAMRSVVRAAIPKVIDEEPVLGLVPIAALLSIIDGVHAILEPYGERSRVCAPVFVDIDQNKVQTVILDQPEVLAWFKREEESVPTAIELTNRLSDALAFHIDDLINRHDPLVIPCSTSYGYGVVDAVLIAPYSEISVNAMPR